PANYRLIALLNVDYKILANAWSQKLALWLPAAIGLDQTGFVPGRDIATNITLLRDLAAQSGAQASKNFSAAILFLAFAKAYETVEHDFLWRALEARGLPKSFVLNVQLLYRGASATLQINGRAAAPLLPGRGVRQGCLLSSPLFLLVLECLLDVLREDEGLKGVLLKGRPSRVV
ncbi:unnamed protein product, partial [Phaeothamnion confervicola]